MTMSVLGIELMIRIMISRLVYLVHLRIWARIMVVLAEEKLYFSTIGQGKVYRGNTYPQI